MLQDGYSCVPAGKIAAVVTSLEMFSRPPRPDPSLAAASLQARVGEITSLRHVVRPDASWYLALYRHIGMDWLWFSRLRLSELELQAILHSRDVEVYAVTVDGADGGLLELDFRIPAQCEIAYFGLTPAHVGRGHGRTLMDRVLDIVFSRTIDRLWVHTCTLDHPDALAFYMQSGFVPFKREVEIADDPRLIGLMPLTAAPHVPVIRAG